RLLVDLLVLRPPLPRARVLGLDGLVDERAEIVQDPLLTRGRIQVELVEIARDHAQFVLFEDAIVEIALHGEESIEHGLPRRNVLLAGSDIQRAFVQPRSQTTAFPSAAASA